MADPKDKTSAGPEPKPAGKSAAVKPPVLEGTARPAEPPKPDTSATPGPSAKPESGASESSKPESIRPTPTMGKPETKPQSRVEPKTSIPSAPSSSAGTAWLAGLVGGVVGLGAAYGLALLGYWPGPAPVTPPEDPRIASVSTAVPELKTVTSTLQDELATLTARVASVESANRPAPEPGEPDTALADQVAALAARLDALDKAPSESGETVAANAAAIARLEADLAAVRQASAETRAELGSVTNQVASIQTDLSAGTAAEQGQARLPLIVSGLEAAFASGAPYGGEVAALRDVLPELSVPEPILAGAATGLKRPDLVARDFNAVLPDILAGRSVSADASWQDATSDWFRGIIALRPTGAVDGDDPEAVVARLESAIARGDFLDAKTQFAALPPAMRSAAGTVGSDIESQAAAQAFITRLRQTALAKGNGA
jgi:hypothetical protein